MQSTWAEITLTMENILCTMAKVAIISQKMWKGEAPLMTGGPTKTDTKWEVSPKSCRLTKAMQPPQACKRLQWNLHFYEHFGLCIPTLKHGFHRFTESSVYHSEGEQQQHRQALYNLRYILTTRGKYA